MNKQSYNQYQRDYQRKRHHIRRAKAIIQLGGSCALCGSTDKLEIDHIDPKTKSFNIGKIWTHSEVKLQAELAKCQLLCKPHHDEKTSQYNSVNHGEGLTGKRNCYCSLCKPLKQAYNKKFTRKRNQGS